MGSRPRFQMRPTTLIATLLAILVVGALVVAISLRGADEEPGVRLVPAEEGSVLSLAGVFPAEEDLPLRNPTGVAFVGRRLYVAESDAGVIRAFTPQGAEVATYTVAPAEGATAFYPTVLADAGIDRLAIVDNAAARVVVIRVDDAGPEPGHFVVGATDPATAPVQPTAVAAWAGELYVADGATHEIRVYSTGDGAYLRTIGGSLEPQLSYVGALLATPEGLYVADSNSGVVRLLAFATGTELRVVTDDVTLPRGLAGADGVLLVLDMFERTMLAVDAEGRLVASTSALGALAGVLDAPRAVAYLADARRAYIADAGTGRVTVVNVVPPAGE
ncbi:MAG: hypothetical protein QMC79_05520 [Anaerosomatales bacterium]|nr:hypothetical protein [Anaerosomatales bacterium]